ncbi:MAG: asparagine synthase (glutamine-hydrolyzing) [Hyphomicrobiaceae bacterium]|nr:asparagine synthase (glutamine-hydrolyzing) [Hyphomicrobiaceae bacterium]
MCGFAGAIDLRGEKAPDRATVERMGDAIRHRGPDENGWFESRGIAIAHRRLSIVGLADGQQPIFNEERTVAVIFNGELFDFPEQRARLEAQGHQFRTHTDTEIIVHLYEQHGDGFIEHMRGQFAFALFDIARRRLILARDRTGICPLHVARRGDTLYFGSEIKALIASGEVPVEVDPLGIDNIFTFFAMPRRRTMYAGIKSVLPGHMLTIELQPGSRAASIAERRYWDLEFPDWGDEDDPSDEARLVDEFEATFRRAVEVRLRADVPVVGYLSGGIDSAAVMAQATSVLGRPIPSFTVKVPNKSLDESSKAMMASRHIGTIPHVVEAGPKLISQVYPDLVSAADCPVIDTACAALHALSRAVHDNGYKVALTGEGSDEALAGYVWFKTQRFVQTLGLGSRLPGRVLSRTLRKIVTPSVSFAELAARDATTGGKQAQTELYHLVGTSRHKFYSREMFDRLGGASAYGDLELDTERMRRWNPLNQSLYLGYKVMLPGLLLNHKGDRVAMANSVEARYPFLDENVIALTSRLAPRWKLRGLRMDKYLLRKTAARWLPHEIALRPKAMFRAPFAESFIDNAPPYVAQLLSEEALRKTGYFDVAKVRRFYALARMGELRPWHFFNSMGLASVLATQLWHHQNLGGGLCDLPHRELVSNAAPAPAEAV